MENINLYEEMNEQIAGILKFGDKASRYAATYIEYLRAENKKLKSELNSTSERVRKETAKEILQSLKRAVKNVSPSQHIGLELWIEVTAKEYGVEVE